MSTETSILGYLGEAYREVKRVDRDLRLEDRLGDDLEVDSLDAIDMLMIVEERAGHEFISELPDTMETFETVGQLVDWLEARLRA